MRYLVPARHDSYELIPPRDGFGEGLVELGRNNPDVVALCGDLVESTRVQAFAEAFPERYFEMGVAEQNMAGVAAGLSLASMNGVVKFTPSLYRIALARSSRELSSESLNSTARRTPTAGEVTTV